MFNESYQLMSLVMFQNIMNERQRTGVNLEQPEEEVVVKSRRKWSRVVMRKTGVYMMRVGGKLVYMGTEPYVEE